MDGNQYCPKVTLHSAALILWAKQHQLAKEDSAIFLFIFLINYVLCRPPGGGPRLDRRARMQFWRVKLGEKP